MSTGVALLFSRTFGTRWGGGQPHAPAASTPGKDPVPIVQEAGWAPGRAENVVPTGIRSRNSPLTLCNFYSYQKGVHYAGIKIFNLLPTQIKCVANEIQGFKNTSKRVLLDNSLYSTDEYFNSNKLDIFRIVTL